MVEAAEVAFVLGKPLQKLQSVHEGPVTGATRCEYSQFYRRIWAPLASEKAKWDDPDVAITRMPVHQGGFARSNVR